MCIGKIDFKTGMDNRPWPSIRNSEPYIAMGQGRQLPPPGFFVSTYNATVDFSRTLASYISKLGNPTLNSGHQVSACSITVQFNWASGSLARKTAECAECAIKFLINAH